ncbi:hypothetical protein MSAN_01950200 [Mycena sanguinolenta]|uniref:Uncharacterized protein n=1 Tax=Mycena sanguinolenta TaxID=230812 RepID=A0A8H6XNP0_9AGAR|nr:hypothetical protein MSAN_01950200 [Mycena sanguinolenta]
MAQGITRVAMTSIRLAALLTLFIVGTLAQPITTTVVTQTPAPNEVLYITTACSPTCPATDNSGNALIASSSCGATCLSCRWTMPGGSHIAEYDTTTGAISRPIGVAKDPSLAPVTCATSTSTSTIYPSRTTQVATSTPTPGEIVSTTTTCSSICPPSDNSGNALIMSSSCGTNCLVCGWNGPEGSHIAQYHVDTGAIFSPIGVAANPSIAAVACTTSAATSFLPTLSSSSHSSTTAPVQSSSTTSSDTSFLPTSTPSSLSSTTTPVQSSTSSVCRTNPAVCARP